MVGKKWTQDQKDRQKARLNEPKLKAKQIAATQAAMDRPEVREKLIGKNTGNTNARGKRTKEQRKRIAQKTREAMNTLERIAQRNSEEAKKKQSDAIRETLSSPETKIRHIEALKKNWESEEYVENWTKGMDGARVKMHESFFNGRISKPQKQLGEILTKNGIQFLSEQWIGKYRVDFLIPSENQIIELYGCYHHQCSSCLAAGYVSKMAEDPTQDDLKRKKYLENQGYTVTIIWHHQLAK